MVFNYKITEWKRKNNTKIKKTYCCVERMNDMYLWLIV